MKDQGRSLGDSIFVLGQPGFESGTFLGREDEDVIFPDGVLRLDGDPQGLLTCLRWAAAGAMLSWRPCSGAPSSRTGGRGFSSKYSTSRGAE